MDFLYGFSVLNVTWSTDRICEVARGVANKTLCRRSPDHRLSSLWFATEESKQFSGKLPCAYRSLVHAFFTSKQVDR